MNISKRGKYLLTIGIFILSMALVILLLVLTQPKEEIPDEDTTSSSTGILVLDHDREDVLYMKIKNSEGEFEIRSGVDGFVIDEYSEFRLNSTVLSAVARCASNITAQALAEENAENLEKYGLAEDSHEAECFVRLRTGDEYTLYFGIDAPEGDTRYFRLSDSNDVYTVLRNSSGYFYYREEDFISLTVTDELTNNNTAPTLDYMTVTRKDLDYDIKFEDDSKNYASDEVSMASAQVMIEPVYAYLDITNSNAIMYGLWGLSAARVEKVHPTEEDFKTYGLDDPFCTVNLDAELVNYHLDIGDVSQYYLDENGEPTTEPAQFYGYFKGVDIVYVFDAAEVPWATFMPIDILSTMMTSNYIYHLDTITIDFFGDDERSYLFDIDGDAETATINGTLNGEAFSGDDFKILYQYLLKCPIDDLCFDEPKDEDIVAEIHFNRIDGGGDTLGFYDMGANRVAVKLNGTTSFSQPRGYLNVLIQNIEDFKNGAKGDELQEVW